MKLAIVHDWLTGMRGGEKCLEVICRRFPDAELHTLLHQPGSTSPAIERMRIRTSYLQRLPGIGRYYRTMLPLMPDAIERLRLPTDVDLVLSFSSAVAKSVIAPPNVPHVCYCFSPMRYAWHLRDDYVKSGSSPWSAARRAVLDRIRKWDRETSNRVTHFIANSHTVAQRIRDCYGRNSTVVHSPVNTDFYTPARLPREDYYLCVSALVPYKRVDLAVEACNRLGRRLIVIGKGPELRRIRRMAGPTIELRGWCSDQEIRDALRRCRALLFPGLEDFGIVPLEAQACGTPVIAFGQGGATETVLPADASTRGTGLFFARQTAEDLALAMRQLEQSPDCCSANLARLQAEQFSLPTFEKNLVAVLRQVHLRATEGSGSEPRLDRLLPAAQDVPSRSKAA